MYRIFYCLILLLQLTTIASVPPGLKGPDGKGRTLNDVGSGIVIVNFWATWCGPCRNEIPILNQIHQEYEKQGVRLIGISVHEKSTAAQIDEFIRKLPVEYEVWRGGTALDMEKLGFRLAIPSTAILQNGKVVDRITGGFKKERLTRKLDQLLAESSKQPL